MAKKKKKYHDYSKILISFAVGLPILAAIALVIGFMCNHYYVFVCETTGMNVDPKFTCLNNPFGIKLFFGALEIAGSLVAIGLISLLIFGVSRVIGEEVIDKTQDVVFAIKNKQKKEEAKPSELKGAVSKAANNRGQLSK